MGEQTNAEYSYSPPTDGQLESFVRVMLEAQARRMGVDIDPVFGARLVMGNPILRAEWLRRHRELQEACSS